MKSFQILTIKIIQMNIIHKITNKEKKIKISNNIEIQKIFSNNNYQIKEIKIQKIDSFSNIETIIIDLKKKEDYNYKKYYPIIKSIQDNQICIEIIKEQNETF